MFRHGRLHDFGQYQRAALDKGGVLVRPGVVTLDASGRHWKCLTPLDMVHKGEGTQRVIYRVRCRRCEACLRQRNVEWINRAKREAASAERTWFVTLTMRPEVHNAIRLLVDSRVGSHPDPKVIQADYYAECYRQVQLFFKRIRKNTGKTFRYLCVTELHKSGLPHFHLLVHDPKGDLKRRDIDNQWLAGFTSSRLVKGDKEKAIAYVCKYLSKDTEGRIKCSLRYGRCGLLPERGEPGGCPPGEPTAQGQAGPQGEAALAEKLTHLNNRLGVQDACSKLAHGREAERAFSRGSDGTATPGAALQTAPRLSRAGPGATGGAPSYPKAGVASTAAPPVSGRSSGRRAHGGIRRAGGWRFAYDRARRRRDDP